MAEAGPVAVSPRAPDAGGGRGTVRAGVGVRRARRLDAGSGEAVGRCRGVGPLVAERSLLERKSRMSVELRTTSFTVT